MGRVEQQDGIGCGLVRISMLTGKNYQEVKQQAMDLPLYYGFGNR